MTTIARVALGAGVVVVAIPGLAGAQTPTPPELQAVDDEAVTLVDSPTVIDVTANDTLGADGELTAIGDVTMDGTATVVDAGRVRYQPSVGFTGTDRFTYEICSASTERCASATVTVHVVQMPHPEGPDEVLIPVVVRGLVTDEVTGAPVGAVVSLVDAAGKRFETRTSTDGRWELIDDPAVPFARGPAVLDVTAADYMPARVELTVSGTETVFHATTLTPAAGPTVDEERAPTVTAAPTPLRTLPVTGAGLAVAATSALSLIASGVACLRWARTARSG